MAHFMTSRGRYPSIRMTDHGRRELAAVHTIMLTAFAGPCPPGMQARHLNDIKTDLRWPENLAWGTTPENTADRWQNGGIAYGERNSHSKLTSQQVLEIRKRRAAGERPYYLAREFGVGYSTIWNITAGRSWAHLPAAS
jgi:hypothetical protein